MGSIGYDKHHGDAFKWVQMSTLWVPQWVQYMGTMCIHMGILMGTQLNGYNII